MDADPTPGLVDDLLEALVHSPGQWHRVLDALDFAAAVANAAPAGLAAVAAELAGREAPVARETLTIFAEFAPRPLAAAAATALALAPGEAPRAPAPRATAAWCLDAGEAYMLAVTMVDRGAGAVGTVAMGDVGEGLFLPLGGGIVVELPQGGAAAWVKARAQALGARATEMSLADVRDRLADGVDDLVAFEEPVDLGLVVALPLIWAALGGDRHALPWPAIEDEDEDDDDEEDDGFAARLLSQMLEEGVDPSDPQALSAWMDDFNNRSHAERGRILGMEDPAEAPRRSPPHPAGRTQRKPPPKRRR